MTQIDEEVRKEIMIRVLNCKTYEELTKDLGYYQQYCYNKYRFIKTKK